jgi:uncharacterized Tic20 family protein
MKQNQNKEFIEQAVDWLDKMELWGMTLITKIISIITPIPVSLQTQKHARLHLEYGVEWSWVIALIVEFMGYAAIYKALQFAEHNRRYTDAKNKAPFKLAIATYVFYLIAVIVFNVIPELATNQKGFIVAMNLVLALFSVPGGVLAGISAIFTERKAAMKQKKTGTPNEANEQPNEQQPNEIRTPKNRRPERRTNEQPNERRPLPQMNERSTERTNEQPLGFPTNAAPNERVRMYIEQVQATQNRTPGQSEIARAVQVSKSTADTVLRKMK